MIKVEELKRNNYLFQKSRGIAVQIDNPRGLHLITAWGVDWPIEDFDPIPLTPELLEKLGATYPYKDDICQISSELFRWRDGELVLWEVDHDVIAAGRPVKFIHEMQNLIFALTGEELTIKETV